MAFEGTREKVGILGELWAFMKVRKKWWLGPHRPDAGPARAPRRGDVGHGGGAVHLHALLRLEPGGALAGPCRGVRSPRVVSLLGPSFGSAAVAWGRSRAFAEYLMSRLSLGPGLGVTLSRPSAAEELRPLTVERLSAEPRCRGRCVGGCPGRPTAGSPSCGPYEGKTPPASSRWTRPTAAK